MSILTTDIKLLASERMVDTSDGGGRRTGNAIPDGVAGNIFPKVSRLDSVYGRVNARKVYAHVDTANGDTYAGAHAALIDAADNDKIKVCIFSTGSDFDDRTAARDRIESYVVSGPESRMLMYGRQLVGQQAITLMQRVEDVLPEVGDVYCLSNEVNGVISNQQYVRVEDVTHEVRNFTDTTGEYTRRIVTLKISATLRYEFIGQEQVSRLSAVARTALVRNTTVADAARYFGIKSLIAAAVAEALEVRVDSIYTNIVPTNLREAAVNSAQISGAAGVQATATAALPLRVVGTAFHAFTLDRKTQTINLGAAVTPGTLQMRVAGSNGAQPSAYSVDDGSGHLPDTGANPYSRIYSGTVDYESGTVTVDASWLDPVSNGLPGVLSATFVPAVAVSQPAHLIELPVTIATRGTVHVQTLNPLPARGTVFIDFRALGKWYRLRDDGTGQLGGDDPAYGTGSIDFVTGNVVATLGALPDVDSSVIFGWASPAHYTIRAGATSDADNVVRQTIQLPQLPVKPGTLSVEYVGAATTYTGTADINGVITGGGLAGNVNHATGVVELQYSARLPNMETAVTVHYQKEVPNVPGDPTTKGDVIAIVNWASNTLAVGEPVQPKGFSLNFPALVTGEAGATVLVSLPARDDGLGSIKTGAVFFSTGSLNWFHAGGQTIGTIDYASGVATIDGTAIVTLKRPTYYRSLGPTGAAMWSIFTDYPTPLSFGDYQFTARLNNASTGVPVTHIATQAASPLLLDLTKTVMTAIVPGSVFFNAVGKSYFDRNGIIYHSMAADATGTEAGSIDYSLGVVTLTNYANNTAPAVAVSACLTKFGNFFAWDATFRTAGSPVRPASTFVQVVAEDGEVLTATCDVDGHITGAFARGKVNQQMGLVSIEWGQMVTAAGNELEPWYRADYVVGSQVWKPRNVMPSTIRYSTVVLSNLPVNADILGLDPVRLPTDGRVPIYRAGDVVLLHNTKLTALANPAVAGATYSMGRTNLADLRLQDTNGTLVPTTEYAVDLAAGTVTMSATMSLGALVQPLKAKHRIEELNLATDVQISGLITLASPLSRDFDTDTNVSSALLFGDMFSRVANVFDQVTFTGVWSDTRIGANATAEYDTVNHPIEVKNDGAVTERWRINFTGATAFQVIGENTGVIVTNGSTASDCIPVNSLTGKPYFTLRAAGWGAGWAVGNQLRFNTIGATAPIWMVRTVLPGAALTGDSIDIQVRGDVDA